MLTDPVQNTTQWVYDELNREESRRWTRIGLSRYFQYDTQSGCRSFENSCREWN